MMMTRIGVGKFVQSSCEKNNLVLWAFTIRSLPPATFEVLSATSFFLFRFRLAISNRYCHLLFVWGLGGGFWLFALLFSLITGIDGGSRVAGMRTTCPMEFSLFS